MFGLKPTETPISGVRERCKNFWKSHFRGLIGFFVPLFTLPFMLSWGEFNKTVVALWLWMFWTLLWQPVNVPVVGLMPLFALPMFGALNTVLTCACYFTEGIAFFIIGGYVVMLLNNANFDRRIMSWLMVPKKEAESLGKIGIIVQASFAAFITALFSHKLIASKKLMEIVTIPLLKSSKGQKKEDKILNLDRFRFVVANAIQTSATIGGLGFVHGSYAIMGFRAIYQRFSIDLAKDDFNFLSYTLFAMPMVLTMFMLNLAYNVILAVILCKGQIGKNNSIFLRDMMIETKKEKLHPKITLHEILSIISLIALLIAYFTRWSWSIFRNNGNTPYILDTTVSAIFAVALHTIPKSYTFLTYFKPNKWTINTAPEVKPESAILFWRYCDKNTCYSYIFLLGAGISISLAIQTTKADELDFIDLENFFTNMDWSVGVLLIMFFTVILCHAMTSCGVLIMILSVVINFTIAVGDANKMLEWSIKHKLTCLSVGIACNFGFGSPFMFTSAYFCKTIARVPYFWQLVLSIGSTIICLFTSWVMIVHLGLLIFIAKQ